MSKLLREVVEGAKLTDEEIREEFKKYYTKEQLVFPEEYFDIITGIIAVVRQAQIQAILKALGATELYLRKKERIADTVEVECWCCKYHNDYPMNCYVEPIKSPFCRHRYELADKIIEVLGER